ncbi:hypothetical protein KI387_000297, partial [Taxus chinensis]
MKDQNTLTLTREQMDNTIEREVEKIIKHLVEHEVERRTEKVLKETKESVSVGKDYGSMGRDTILIVNFSKAAHIGGKDIIVVQNKEMIYINDPNK